MSAPRDEVRERIVAAAARLLTDEGPQAVTTRAVAATASVQAPVIYRLFGDKDGLLDAVAEHVYTVFVSRKKDAAPLADPVEDLAVGWDLAVGFGLAYPSLHTTMYSTPERARDGLSMVRAKVDRLATAGLLRLDPDLAVATIQATARGAVLTGHQMEDPDRDSLLQVMRNAMLTAVTFAEPQLAGPGPEVAARALHASLSATTALLPAERQLLAVWLQRIGRGH